MKFRDVALTVLIVLAVVILVFLLSSRNPKEGVVAPLVVPVRTFFGYLGGRRGGNTNIKINVKGGGGAASSSSSSSGGGGGGEDGESGESGGSGPALGPPIISGPIGPIVPPSGLGPTPPISPFTNYASY